VERPSTLAIQNGRKGAGVFSQPEMSARLERLRAHMARADVDAAVFTSIHNINYFTGFVYCSFGRSFGLVVTQDRSVTVSANVDGGQPWRRSFGDQVAYTDWQQDNFFVAVDDLVAGSRRVGVELDHLSVENHAKLAATLTGVELVDLSAATMHMRMVKSDEEIALITEGARIADVGGWACIEAIDEDVPEHEVALHATSAMVREIANSFPDSDLMNTWTWFQTGINTDGAHNPVTTRRIRHGDILSLNCFPMIAGYYHALERTLFFGCATPRQLELWEVNCEVHRRGLDLIRPGARCSEIAGELNEIYRGRDLLQYRTFGYGHSFGTLCHYYGREAGLELREDIDTVLEPGMVVSMEPMIMLPEGLEGAGGYREHDILVVTDSGADNITGFPFGPEHNIVCK